jgi:hypothetical protein
MLKIDFHEHSDNSLKPIDSSKIANNGEDFL